MKKIISVLMVTALMAATQAWTTPAWARKVTIPETLPVEIALLYYKLRGVTPNYELLIRNNFQYQQAGTAATRAELMRTQKTALQKLYETMGKGSPIMIKRQMTVVKLETQAAHTVRLAPLYADEPQVFSSLAGDQYGVFMRNAADLEILAEPFLYDDILVAQHLMDYNETVFPVELIINPLAADAQKFPMPTGADVNVILGEVTDIKIYNPLHPERMLMHKRLIDMAPQEDWSLGALDSKEAPINPETPILPPLDWQ